MTTTTITQSLELPTIHIIQGTNMPAASKIVDRPYTWSEVQHIIATNELAKFARSQHQTTRYHDFKHELATKKITIFEHILTNELGWQSCEPRGQHIFTDGSDLKIIPNHFPYYFEEDVKHYCVWSKLKIPSDDRHPLGDLSPGSRRVIERYVVKTFVENLGIPRENLVWFRNWEALQSVKALSHIHVIVKGITAEQEKRLLYGCGVPLSPQEFIEYNK